MTCKSLPSLSTYPAAVGPICRLYPKHQYFRQIVPTKKYFEADLWNITANNPTETNHIMVAGTIYCIYHIL